MFAQGGDIFHIEFIEGDDAIDLVEPREITYRVEDGLHRQIFGHGKNFTDAVEGPVGVAEFFHREQQDGAPQGFAGADEFLALFVGADAEDGERSAFRHAWPP